MVDDNNNPLDDVIIIVEGIDKPVNTTKNGEYWRLLVPGKYRVRAQSPSGKFSQVEDVDVPDNQGPML